MKNRKTNNSSQKLEELKKKFGNYRLPDQWSDKAKKVALPVLHDTSLLAKAEAVLAKKIVDFYKNEVGVQKITLFAQRFIKDLYRLDVLPRGKQFLKDREWLDLFGQDVAAILKEFGEYGILFSDSRYVIEARLIEEQIVVAQDLILTMKPVGMPLKHFLLWFGTDKIVLKEWSGIVPKQQEFVYKQLLDYFRDYLENEHKIAEKYSALE